MHTLQTIFNRAYAGVVAQGKPSYAKGGCKYRGQDDCRCGIGHNIDDQYYLPEFDTACSDHNHHFGDACSGISVMSLSPYGGNTGRWLRLYESLVSSGVDMDDHRTREFCIRLQTAHDSAVFGGPTHDPEDSVDFLSRFDINMRQIAIEFELVMPRVKTTL